MTTVTIKDIPVTQELSDGAARKIVGGRWSERNETPGRPSAYDPTTGDGAASMTDAWWIYGEGGVGNGGEYGKISLTQPALGVRERAREPERSGF